MISVIVLVSLATSATSQLLCHPETLTYNYENELKLWGSVEQSYHVTCNVDIDCEGESDSPVASDGVVAFDFIAHIKNLIITEGKVSPQNVRKLCKSSQNPATKCSVGGQDDAGDAVDDGDAELTTHDKGIFSLPVRFTQTRDGKILRLQFMEKDFENHDVMNMKKGIISTLQTRISGKTEKEVTDVETDVTGTHDAHYNTDVSAQGMRVKKAYSSLDDKDKLSAVIRQAEIRVLIVSVVKNGEVVDSKGETRSQMPEDEVSTDDLDPEDMVMDVDVGQVLSSTSQFDMKLIRKTKRSASRIKRMAKYKSLEFLSTSLAMDLSDKTEEKYEVLERLYGQLKQTSVKKVVKKFSGSKDEDDLKVIKQIIMLETELGFAKIQRKLQREGKRLVNILVSETYGLMSHCRTSWDTCREILELYSLGGGRRAEEVMEFMLSAESTLSPAQQLDVINIASFMVNPSDEFVISLIHLLEKENPDSDKFSSFLLGLGTLAGHPTVSESNKHIVSAIFLKELNDITPGHCPEDVRHADALEAIGNMEDERFMERLMEINAACESSKIMRIALIHAMRGFLHDNRAQDLLIHTLSHFECEVSQNTLNLLIEIIQSQQIRDTDDRWPQAGFSRFDVTLKALLTKPGHLRCLRKDAIRYFKEKRSEDAQALAKSLVRERGSANGNGTLRISKRGIKQHSSCSTWNSFRGRYNDIQSTSSFIADISTYNRRKHCLGHFRIGASKASADIYAGYFAGYRYPVSSNKKKLFAKAVAKGTIFKKSFSIGTVLFYFQMNGVGRRPTGRIYARVAGKTLIDKSITRASYRDTKRVFSKSITIPLAKIPLYIITININLFLSAKIELTADLRICNTLDMCLTYTPKAMARASAGASVSLGLVKGGADLGVNLNYYVQGEARVRITRFPCIVFSHGADRNSISLQFWFQIRSKFKVKIRWWPPRFRIEWKWGSKKTWRPSSLRWSISSARKTVIYSSC